MGQDEEGTLSRIKSLRREVIEPKVKEYYGRVFKTTGDGVLVEFQSPVEAVRCAVGLQEALASKPELTVKLPKFSRGPPPRGPQPEVPAPKKPKRRAGWL
ncbi:hypothetical protein BB934_42195 (plasmid) [Microvirga ossetica]|uniref:Guanylate cyclase domain-containing protein n=2 Tax=Microvirga ossetica TaxID=1882682 RepID=A0A1B2EXZ6_9HYPH|nr:hypothetical protein BB934_42195 [Microvirga ossetica]